jgi:hypothetical protein
MNYSNLLKSSTLLIAADVALLISLEILSSTFSWSVVVQGLLYIIILAGLFVALALYPWSRYHFADPAALTKAFLVGVMIGGFLALVKLIMHQELWTVFNLIAEPLRAGLIGTLLINLTLRMRSTTVYV